MAVEQFDMFHQDHGGKARTTQAAYDALWFPKRWRKSPPTETSSAPAEASNDPASSGSPDPSGDTDDTKEASQ